jgi:hypothetical protein
VQKALATVLLIWCIHVILQSKVTHQDMLHYLQRECLVRLVVVYRQGLFKSPGETDCLSFPFISKVKVNVTLQPMVGQPVYLGVKHPSGTQDQIFITVRQLQVC